MNERAPRDVAWGGTCFAVVASRGVARRFAMVVSSVTVSPQ